MTRELNRTLWPGKARIDTVNDNSRELWLTQKVGYRGKEWSVIYHSDKIDYYFKDANHSIIFLLKWS
jgi:hypothetical protein